jgi:hypothetical protein
MPWRHNINCCRFQRLFIRKAACILCSWWKINQMMITHVIYTATQLIYELLLEYCIRSFLLGICIIWWLNLIKLTQILLVPSSSSSFDTTISTKYLCVSKSHSPSKEVILQIKYNSHIIYFFYKRFIFNAARIKETFLSLFF